MSKFLIPTKSTPKGDVYVLIARCTNKPFDLILIDEAVLDTRCYFVVWIKRMTKAQVVSFKLILQGRNNTFSTKSMHLLASYGRAYKQVESNSFGYFAYKGFELTLHFGIPTNDQLATIFVIPDCEDKKLFSGMLRSIYIDCADKTNNKQVDEIIRFIINLDF